MSRFAKQQHGDTDATSLQLGDDFAKAHCLLNSEVLLLLQDLHERRKEEAMSLPLPPPSKVFTECMEHVKTFGQYTNRELVRAIRQSMMNSALHEFEMAQIGNLAPTTAEEARLLIPSLASGKVEEEELQRILDDITTTRKYEL